MALWRSLDRAPEPVERKDAVTRRHSSSTVYAPAGVPLAPPMGSMDIDTALTDAWGRVVWVYRAIDARAKNAAKLTVRVNTSRNPRASQEIENHPLTILLNRMANKYETANQFRYRLHTQLDLSVKGVFVEVVVNRRGDPSELHLLHPKQVFPIPDPDTFVERFEMRLANGETFDQLRPYQQGQGGVLWIKRAHPTDPYLSSTWLEAAGISIDIDHYARMYNRNFLRNDGRPGGLVILSAEDDIDPGDAAEMQRKMMGGPGQAGRVAIMEATAGQYYDLSMTPRDAQYIESRAITKGEILAAAGTPESLWNASGRTYDNADAELEAFWLNEMQPEAEMVASFYDMLTNGGILNDDEVVTYAWEEIDVLNRRDREIEDRAASELINGTISIDEYRIRTGKDPLDLPGTRVLWLPSGKAPVGSPEDVAEILGQGQAPPDGAGGGIAPPSDGGTPALPDAGGGETLAIEPPAESEDPIGDIVLGEVIEAKSLPKGRDPFQGHRKAAAALVDVHSVKLQDEIRRLFRVQEKVILARLTGSKARKHTRHWVSKDGAIPRHELKKLDPEYVVDRRRWIDEVVSAIAAIVKSAFGAAGQYTAVNLTGDDGAEFDGGKDAAAIVAQTVRTIAEGFDARAGHLQDIVQRGDEAGNDIEQIADKVKEAFLNVDTWAEVTSRQVVGAMNAAQQIAAVDAGAVRKRWLATDDERTRLTHQEAEGQIVDMDAKFDVGEGELMFPGDPTGPVGEWINCRCTMLFQTPERDFDAELDADLAALDAYEGKGLIGHLAGEFGHFVAASVVFNPADHPRDHHGRFIDTPNVTLSDGSHGVAVAENVDGTITVAKPDGAVIHVETSTPAVPSASLDTLPPAIGTAPIPEGTVRLYHQTWERHVPNIRENGLLESQAQGDGGQGAGNEPSAGVWASTGRPNGADGLEGPSMDSERAVVEFYATPEQISDRADSVAGRSADEFSAGYHHVIMRGDVPPDQIVAIHEPWHSAARYIEESPDTLAAALAGEFDNLGDEYPAYARALDYLKRTHGIVRPELETQDFEGRVGDDTHITRTQNGTLPTSAIASLRGAKGETPGAHANRQGEKWDAFKADIAANGIKNPIFITVDHGQDPVISEGNHRRDAAVELGLPTVPVEVKFFGHAEQTFKGWDDIVHPSVYASEAGLHDVPPEVAELPGQAPIEAFVAANEPDLPRDEGIVNPRLTDPGGMHGALSTLMTGVAEAFAVFDREDLDEPGQYQVLRTIPPKPARTQQPPDRFSSATFEARRKIPTVAELVRGGMTPQQAREAWLDRYRTTKNEQIIAANVVDDDAKRAQVADLMQGAGPDDYAVADTVDDSVIPKAIYGLSFEEAVDLRKAGFRLGPGAVLDTDSPWDTWAVAAARLNDGDIVPARNLTVHDQRMGVGWVTKRNGMPYLVADFQGDQDTAMTIVDVMEQAWKDASADLPPEQRATTNGLAYSGQVRPVVGMEGKFVDGTGGDGTIAVWAYPPRADLYRHELGHNVDAAPLQAGQNKHVNRPEWKRAIASDQQNWGRVLLVFSGGQMHMIHEPMASPSLMDERGADAPSVYGLENDHENFAESLRLYLMDRFHGTLGYATVDGEDRDVRFADLYPGRAEYFDRLFGTGERPAKGDT